MAVSSSSIDDMRKFVSKLCREHGIACIDLERASDVNFVLSWIETLAFMVEEGDDLDLDSIDIAMPILEQHAEVLRIAMNGLYLYNDDLILEKARAIKNLSRSQDGSTNLYPV